jgi:hypothetical protein
MLVKRSEVMKVDGACHCSFIAIEAEVDPENVTICHCTDCQIGTGTAFRVSVPAPGKTFKMTGQPAIYLKTTAESGNPRAQGFCPKMRLATLFDGARRRPTGVIHATRRHIAPARSAHSAAANMVSFGAIMGHRARPHAAGREAARHLAPALTGAGLTGARRRAI